RSYPLHRTLDEQLLRCDTNDTAADRLVYPSCLPVAHPNLGNAMPILVQDLAILNLDVRTERWIGHHHVDASVLAERNVLPSFRYTGQFPARECQRIHMEDIAVGWASEQSETHAAGSDQEWVKVGAKQVLPSVLVQSFPVGQQLLVAVRQAECS